MVLFEVVLLIFMTLFVMLFSKEEPSHVAGMSVSLAVIAMIWNFIYNFFFDKIFTGPRLERGLILRILHATIFESGLIIFSTPIIAWVLHMSLWEAFLLDIGLTLLIVLYTIAFNWTYDYLRETVG